MSPVAGGIDQLKEERLRYLAASALEPSAEDSEDCWDHSSEDDRPQRPDTTHNLSIAATSAAASTDTSQPQAESCAQADTQQTLGFHDRLSEHAKLTTAVKHMLQQHGTVRDKPCALGIKPVACLYRCIC